MLTVRNLRPRPTLKQQLAAYFRAQLGKHTREDLRSVGAVLLWAVVLLCLAGLGQAEAPQEWYSFGSGEAEPPP